MLFSIIVPVYNVDKYLNECLDSIINQVKELSAPCELLLIDDGSTDLSGKICDQYAEHASNWIHVYHNKNQGLLLTRRFGFQRAKGEYIINCDSDDLLEAYALKTLKNLIEESGRPDVIIFNYYLLDGQKKNIAFENLFTKESTASITRGEVLKEFLVRHSVVSVCGKICKRSCIEIGKDYSQYVRISNGEDSLQSLEIFDQARSYIYLNQPLYDYRIDSGMTRKFDSNYYESFKYVFTQIEQRKEAWNLSDFNTLFAVKVLSIAGRAITQSRFKKWDSFSEHKEYLMKIREDETFKQRVPLLKEVSGHLQRDHVILLHLLDKKYYAFLIFLLRAKNLFGIMKVTVKKR
ncbi:glycosyltransferase family 2 protein [Eisenbergiella sp.]